MNKFVHIPLIKVSPPLKKAVRRGATKYAMDGLFLLCIFFLYNYLPYYQNFLTPLAKLIINSVFLAWATYALPYYIWLNYKKAKWFDGGGSKSKIMMDAVQRIFSFRVRAPIVLSRPERIALLSTIVKVFFFPIMVNFFSYHAVIIVNLLRSIPVQTLDLSVERWLYAMIISVIFALDTLIFSFAYAVEWPPLRNRIRSVDTSIGGWTVALIAYPPFSSFTSSYTWEIVAPLSHVSNVAFIPFAVSRVVIILLYGVYLWATLALLWRAGNLVNRGIVCHGPYKYIRHPAYTVKNIAWCLETIPYMTTPIQIIPLVIWNAIYVLRALTEEKHLLKDRAYRYYARQVRYRFIPRVI